MEKLFNNISITAGLLGGIIAKALGGSDTLLYCLLAVIILDYATGVLRAIMNKTLSSSIGFKGLIKKVMIFIVVACSVILSKITDNVIPIRETTIMFFVCNEIISVLENAAEFVNIPPKMKSVLLQLRNTENEEVDSNGNN